MKRIIVDYKKLTPKLLKLLTDKFPDGYNDDDVITFENHKNEIIEAVEVRTNESVYLVKVSSKLHYTMNNFEGIEDTEVDDLGHVVINDDIKSETFKDEEE
ncbi:hypothetical protein [Xanthomarina spongicola]|uniref:DNA primase n=1 Tax=Xanthomarina spongicola TaxID=570520 RepID=A0A316DPT0_9FLAO|nr:hypothetical protein [Xanthomarina spongicola]PWK19975.1 hypothetical protein LX78_01325 [Xanthomarina spongicola]